MTGGRPLRFLAVLLCGWTGARGIALYRDLTGEAQNRIVPAERVAPARITPVAVAVPLRPTIIPMARSPVVPTGSPRHAATRIHPAGPPRAVSPPRVVMARPESQTTAVASVLSPAAMPPPIAQARSRLTGSLWLIARDGSAVAPPGGQLGGSQAGMRVTYALGATRRFALSARLSAPLAGRGAEAAIGLDWQPTRTPVHVVAEQRIALDGGRGGPTIGVVGGFGPTRVVSGLTVEGYGQAGVIARDGGEAFADGAVRAGRRVIDVAGVRIDAGAGLWGGAQRGAARLDIGPSLGILVPIGRQGVRIGADWRQRIAGASRPDSGPAVSIGTGF